MQGLQYAIHILLLPHQNPRKEPLAVEAHIDKGALDFLRGYLDLGSEHFGLVALGKPLADEGV